MIVIYFNWECIFHNLRHEIKDYDHCLNFYYVSFVMLKSLHAHRLFVLLYFFCVVFFVYIFFHFILLCYTCSVPFIWKKRRINTFNSRLINTPCQHLKRNEDHCKRQFEANSQKSNLFVFRVYAIMLFLNLTVVFNDLWEVWNGLIY